MDKQYLKRRGQTWYVRVRVPPSLKGTLGAEIVRTTGTTDLAEARRRRWPIVATIKKHIAEVQAAGVLPPDSPEWFQNEAKLLARSVRSGETSPDMADIVLDVKFDQWADRQERDPETGEVLLDDPADVETIRTGFKALSPEGVSLLSETIEDYLAEVSRRIQKQTLNMKRKRLNDFLSWHKDCDISRVSKRRAGQYVTEVLQHKGLAVKSVKDTLSDLSAFFRWAEVRGLVERNPFYGLSGSVRESTRGGPKKRRGWTTDELKAALTGFPVVGDRWHKWIMAAIALYTGMRQNEIAETRLEDVHKDRIHIPEGKTESSVRDVPIHPAIRPLVKALKEHSQDGYLIPGLKRGGEDDKRAHYFSKRFGPALRRLGVKDKAVVFHSLRNSFNNALERAGVPLSTAKLIVGHSRDDLTYGTYSQGLPFPQLKAAVESVSYGDEIDSIVSKGAKAYAVAASKASNSTDSKQVTAESMTSSSITA